MSWQEIYGHARQLAQFRQAARRSRLASTFLFVGPEGIGKRKFARQLARSLFCQKHSENELQSCDVCPQCLQVLSGNHPDLLELRKPTNKNSLPIGLFTGGDDFGSGLCHDIAIKPASGGRRIAIIDDADYLSQESGNALLKTLEEPPPGALLILIGTSEQQQLPTILSRSQIVRFSPLSDSDLRAILEVLPLEEGTPLEQLVPASSGSVQLALLLRQPEAYQFRSRLLEQLASLNPAADDFLKTLLSFVGEKEAEGAVKRAKLRWIADLTIEFYGRLAQRLGGLPDASDEPVLAAALESALSRWQGPLGNLAGMVERTEAMSSQIEMYLNSSNLLGTWLGDLTRLAHGEQLMPVEF